MRILALTHGTNVGPGVFADPLRAAGHELVEWNVPERGAPPDGADALLSFGGAMPPDDDERHPWLADERRFLARALERGTPILGVCLGAQLLASAAGAAAFRAREPEVGWVPVELTGEGAADPVFRSLPQRFEAFEWHHYTFELPEGAVELARSEVCTQAFRLDSAWAMQFHAEITEPQIAEWMLQATDDVDDADALRAATRNRIGAWNDLGRRVARAFADELA